MGNYINFNVKMVGANPEKIARELSLITGGKFLVTLDNGSSLPESVASIAGNKGEEKGDESVFYIKDLSGFYDYMLSVDENGNGSLFDFGEKFGNYENIAKAPLHHCHVLETLASNLGGCEVTITAEEGCVGPSSADESGVLRYKTLEKQGKTIWELDEALGRDTAFQINTTAIYSNLRDKESRFSFAFETIAPLVANGSISTSVEMANAIGILFYENKPFSDIEVEDIDHYLKQVKRFPFSKDEYLVSSFERASGLEQVFLAVGETGKANYVKSIYEELARKKEASDNQKNAYMTVKNALDASKIGVYDNIFKTEDGNHCFVVCLGSAVDTRRRDLEAEKIRSPFGNESVSISIFPGGITTFKYKNKEIQQFCATEIESVRCESLYDALKKIKNPDYLKTILDGLKDPDAFSISPAEMGELKGSISRLESRANEKRASLRGGLVYLDVPYAEKDEAKELGAKWDKTEKKWFVNPSSVDMSQFSKWNPDEREEQGEERDR